jgi:hypothetical protein
VGAAEGRKEESTCEGGIRVNSGRTALVAGTLNRTAIRHGSAPRVVAWNPTTLHALLWWGQSRAGGTAGHDVLAHVPNRRLPLECRPSSLFDQLLI